MNSIHSTYSLGKEVVAAKKEHFAFFGNSIHKQSFENLEKYLEVLKSA